MWTSRPDAKPASARYRVAVSLALLALAPWAIDAVRLLAEGFRVARTTFPTCITEVSILDGARCVAEGKSLYPPFGRLPYTIHIYNPLTYLGAGLAGRWLGLDLDGVLVAGKMISFASAIGILAVVAVHVAIRSRDWRMVVLAPTMVVVYHSSTLTDFFRNRPETPGIVFSLAGWALAQHRPRGWTALAAACFALAFEFKQVFLAAPAAVGLALILGRESRPLIRLALATAALVALAMLASRARLGEGYLWHTVFAVASNPRHFIEGATFFYPILVRVHWGLLLPTTLVAAAWLLGRDRRDPLVLYLALCAAWTTWIHSKAGADLNYHGELSLLMVLTVISATSGMIAARSPMVALTLGPLILATWLPIARDGPGGNGICPSRILPTPHCTIDGPPFGDMAPYLSRYRGRWADVLSFHDELAVRSGDPMAIDWVLLELLFQRRLLDPRALERLVQERRYPVVVFPASLIFPTLRRLHEASLRAGYIPTFADEEILELTLDRPIEPGSTGPLTPPEAPRPSPPAAPTGRPDHPGTGG